MTDEIPSRGKVLYLSYDGMTDPLGEAQVIPYLCGLGRFGYDFHLVSFEKRHRFAANEQRVRAILNGCGIEWHPMFYTKRPPVLSSVWDVIRLRWRALGLQRRHRFVLVHCRSYIPSLVGLMLKRRKGVRFIFDMRGFWPEERVDGGLWKLSNPLFRTVFRYFKRKEKEFLESADGIVSLTEAGREDLEKRGSWPVPIDVIPCSVDFDRFRIPSVQESERARSALGIRQDAVVGAYLGSLGTWYRLPEMLELFRLLVQDEPKAHLLVLTPDDADSIYDEAAAKGLERSRITVRSVSRADVPFYLSASDYGIFFIQPSYSKVSSSPTKLGEYLAMGLPVITNRGVGDVDRVLEQTGAGYAASGFEAGALAAAASELKRLLELDRETIRSRAKDLFNLDLAVESYRRMYVRSLAGGPQAGSEPAGLTRSIDA